MADFEELDPTTRCFALVGQFLQAWSVMEGSLHSAIGAALAIEETKLQILCANIEFGAKIYILRTLIDAAPDLGEDKGNLQSSLRSLAEYAKVRNMIAHHPFQPDELKKGVEFLVVKARGKFELPKEVWLGERFRTEGEQVSQYRTLLDRIVKLFAAHPLPPQNYTAVLHRFLPEHGEGYFVPMRQMMSPALLDHLSRQAPPGPGSNPASGETGVRTPDKLQE